MSLPSFSPLGGKGEGLGRRHVCYRRGQRSGLQPKCYVWHAAEAPAAVAPALSVSSLRNAALALKRDMQRQNLTNFMLSIVSQHSRGYRGIAVNTVSRLIKMIFRESVGVILFFSFGVLFT